MLDVRWMGGKKQREVFADSIVHRDVIGFCVMSCDDIDWVRSSFFLSLSYRRRHLFI